MKRALISAVAIAVAAATVSAQSPLRRPEIRPFAGALIATGDQRDLYKNAPMFGVQTALEMNPNFHLVATFGYSSLTSKYTVADDAADAFMYDAGVEFDMVRPLIGEWQFKPFIGAGAGGRSYRYSDSALKDQTCFSGYGTLGTEFQLSRIALRLEGRDNLFCYRSPIAGVNSKNRNDLVFSFGLAYHIR